MLLFYYLCCRDNIYTEILIFYFANFVYVNVVQSKYGPVSCLNALCQLHIFYQIHYIQVNKSQNNFTTLILSLYVQELAGPDSFPEHPIQVVSISIYSQVVPFIGNTLPLARSLYKFSL